MLPNDGQVHPHHAKIKMVVNRWMIESEGDWLIRVGNGVPGRKCWLKPSDEILLTTSGAKIVFNMTQPAGGQVIHAADMALGEEDPELPKAPPAQPVVTTGATRAAVSPKPPLSPPAPKGPPPLPPDAIGSPLPLASGPPQLPKSEEPPATPATQPETQRTSAPSPHANASVSPDSATLRRKIEGLRQSLVQQVLNPQSDVSNIEPIATFRDEHTRLQDQLKQLQHRQQELSKAKAEYEPLDNAYQQKTKELAAAEANLKQFARPLGKAAFEALVAGHVQNQPIFNDRFAVHARIGELQTEHDRLASPHDAGMVQKTKAKAQQLVVAGKIKLEEIKVGKLEEQIGGQLIASNKEDSVRCDRTVETLVALAKQRSVIAQPS
ncbi:MAG: hypothetical protein NTY19_06675 [Planctomycetota bacterium]|nr:hypothetical protein [Planctomycetota bacterium]